MSAHNQFAFQPARAFVVLLLVLLAGCGLGFLLSCGGNPRNTSDAQLRAQAAKDTERAKARSKEALQQARIAAASTERKIDDITAGVQEGIKGNRPAKGAKVDINTASEVELVLLPGISLTKANQIEKHRPYKSAHQLVARGLLTEPEFAVISSRVTAH